MFGISYWFLPLFAGCCWLGTLLAMLGTWLAQGSPHYDWMSANQRLSAASAVAAVDQLSQIDNRGYPRLRIMTG